MHFTQLRNIRLEDGRVRYVLLKQNYDGILVPEYYANLFILIKHNDSPSNTIKQVLLAVRCLMAWADRENIDINGRMRSFHFLHEHELNNISSTLNISPAQLVLDVEALLKK